MKRLLCPLLATLLAASAGLAQYSPEADVVSEHLAALSARNLDGVLRTLADTVELHVEGSGGRGGANVVEAQPQLRLRYAGLLERYPNARYELIDLLSERELVVARELVTIREVGIVRVTAYRVEDGRIRRMWVYFSTAPGLSAY